VNNYLDDWLRVWVNKGLAVEIKREVIKLRENKETYGRHFLGKMIRKIGKSNR
jgi:hypothetical protein